MTATSPKRRNFPATVAAARPVGPVSIAPVLAAASIALIVALSQASGAVPDRSSARSQVPGWCLNGGGQNTNAGGCVYRTLEQCVDDRIGQGGHCDPNPSAPRGTPFNR
jgi:Protein of unknown function (DUF3551)